MICTIAIQGYRSLRELVLPLGQLTVISGANGSGKSSVYRSLRLLADAAQNAVIASLAREGGLSSTFWAAPETIAMSYAEANIRLRVWHNSCRDHQRTTIKGQRPASVYTRLCTRSQF